MSEALFTVSHVKHSESSRPSHDLFDYVSVNFGKPLLAPLVQVTERILIQTELIEDRGVNVGATEPEFRNETLEVL